MAPRSHADCLLVQHLTGSLSPSLSLFFLGWVYSSLLGLLPKIIKSCAQDLWSNAIFSNTLWLLGGIPNVNFRRNPYIWSNKSHWLIYIYIYIHIYYSNKLLIVAISIGFTWHRLPIDIIFQVSCETNLARTSARLAASVVTVTDVTATSHLSATHVFAKSQKIASATTCCWAKTWEQKKLNKPLLFSGEKRIHIENIWWIWSLSRQEVEFWSLHPPSMWVWVIMLLHFPILETLWVLWWILILMLAGNWKTMENMQAVSMICLYIIYLCLLLLWSA